MLRRTLHSIRQSLKKEEPSDGSALTFSRLRYTLISISSTLAENDLNCTFNIIFRVRRVKKNAKQIIEKSI